MNATNTVTLLLEAVAKPLSKIRLALIAWTVSSVVTGFALSLGLSHEYTVLLLLSLMLPSFYLAARAQAVTLPKTASISYLATTSLSRSKGSIDPGSDLKKENVELQVDRDTLIHLLPVANHLGSQALEKLREFSEPAKNMASERVLDYANKLLDAAAVSMRSAAGDNVSEANVMEAAYSLSEGMVGGHRNYVGIVGGIFLGASISTLISVIEIGKFERTKIIFTAVAGILGAFLTAVDVLQSTAGHRKSRPGKRPHFVVKRRSASQAPKATSTPAARPPVGSSMQDGGGESNLKARPDR